MAVTIKLKNASGSDPSASDLVLGELAVRTDNGKIFLKKDDGNVAEVSGGGIDDGDKGDITVSNDGATFTIDNSAVTTGKLNNSAVTFAKLQDISQNIIAGRVSSGSGPIQSLTAANVRTIINVEDGATADQTASEILTLIKTVDGSGSGLDADLLDGSTGADYLNYNNFTNTPTIPSNNNQLTNGAGYITATLTNEQVQDIVGGMVTGNTESGITVTYQDGDGTLDFSVASQTDNNFTNSDHSKLDGIESGATADQSASEILTLLKTVDGTGSGLDADTIDGMGSSSFLRSDAADTASSDITFSGGAGAATIDGGSDIRFTNGDWTGNIGTPKIQGHASALYLCGGSSGIRFRYNDGDRWHIDGSGHFVPASNTTYNIGSSSNYVNELFVEDVYCSNWLRQSSENIGLYNSATGQHWYSDSAKYWAMDNDGTNGGIIFRDSHGGTIRGYLYYNNSNNIGFLDSDGNWALQVKRDVSVDFLVNGQTEATILPNTVRCEGAFFENAQAVNADKTISDGYNAMSAGPITINSGITVTIGSGEAWTIV